MFIKIVNTFSIDPLELVHIDFDSLFSSFAMDYTFNIAFNHYSIINYMPNMSLPIYYLVNSY